MAGMRMIAYGAQGRPFRRCACRTDSLALTDSGSTATPLHGRLSDQSELVFQRPRPPGSAPIHVVNLASSNRPGARQAGALLPAPHVAAEAQQTLAQAQANASIASRSGNVERAMPARVLACALSSSPLLFPFCSQYLG